MTTKEQVLQNCKIEGNIVKLPDVQLDRKLYMEVAKALELIGGKWKGGKVYGFVFASDPTELLEQIANGEKRNLKKEYQFFATPDDIADKLVSIAEIEPAHKILEPSAGQGAIVNACLRALPSKRQIDCCELMDVNRTILNKNDAVLMIANDFLSVGNEFHNYYDRIIANPPFTKNQDIDHVYKMYECLADGGKMVTLTSRSWETGSQKKQVEFADWLHSKGNYASVRFLANGAFKESGTMISVAIIEINKPGKPKQPETITTPSFPSSSYKEGWPSGRGGSKGEGVINHPAPLPTPAPAPKPEYTKKILWSN